MLTLANFRMRPCIRAFSADLPEICSAEFNNYRFGGSYNVYLTLQGQVGTERRGEGFVAVWSGKRPHKAGLVAAAKILILRESSDACVELLCRKP